MQDVLKSSSLSRKRPEPSGLDVTCKLRHFALITYPVEPESILELLPARFRPDTVVIDGEQKALVSVVCFQAVDFAPVIFPSGQHNAL